MKYKLKVAIVSVFIFAFSVSLVGAQQFEVGVAEKSSIGLVSQASAAALNPKTASASASALIVNDKRGTIETFLMGPDEKSLKAAKAELVLTNNNLTQAKDLISISLDDATIVKLNTQINDLEYKKALLEKYIVAHENTFSVLGWFKKIFKK